MSRARVAVRFSQAALVLAAVFVLTGCGGGSDSATASNNASVEGYVFGPAAGSGPLTLGYSATPPGGLTPVAGATVRVSDPAVQVETDSTGHFRIDGAAPGSRSLHVDATGYTPSDSPLTLLGGATVRVGAPAYSRQQAIDLVKQEAAKTAALDTVRILAPQQPLPGGVKIRPTLGDPDSTTEVALSSPQWLLYADAHTNAAFQHPVTYYLVDAETGLLAAHAAMSWPTINDRSYYAVDGANAASPDLVNEATRAAAGRSEAVPTVASTPVSRDHVAGCDSGQMYALVIQGFDRGDFAADVDAMEGYVLTPLNNRYSFYRPPSANGATVDAIAEIKSKLNDLCSRVTKCDTLFVFISSHGDPDGAIEIEQGPLPDGEQSQRSMTRLYPWRDLNFDNCKACHIIVVINACYSGKAVADLQSHVEKFPAAFKGKRVVLAASSDVDEMSFSKKNGKQAANSHFANEFTNALRGIAGAPGTTAPTAADLSAAFNIAEPKVIQLTNQELPVVGSERKSQHPKIWVRDPAQLGEPPCGPYLALKLDAPLIDGQGIAFPAGAVIPLSTINGGHAAAPEVPITEDHGCAGVHFHSNNLPVGITVNKAGVTRGPFIDPKPRFCGYGAVVTVGE